MTTKKAPKSGTGTRKLLVGAVETRNQRRRINLEGDKALIVGSLYIIETSLS